MTLNNFTEAIAAKLAALWPDRKVYVGEIPKDADGQFFVGIIESEQENTWTADGSGRSSSKSCIS